MSTQIKKIHKNPLLQRIIGFLERDSFQGFTSDDLFIMQFVKKGWGQDIAALSNMAEALMNTSKSGLVGDSEVKILFNSVVTRALHKKVSPYGKDPRAVKNLGRYGYYLEHLNIILGCYQSAVGSKFLELNLRVTEHLLAASMAEDNCHAPLLPNMRMRWSADQAAIIYSIWLYDQNNGTSLANELRDRWLSYMDTRMRDHGTGLYMTEVMGVKRYSKQPRGCALAYLIYYSRHFAPQMAAEQWDLFKTHMLIKRACITGFREYLSSYKGGWTPDSGPIVAGIGVGASGLALKTAACMADTEIYDALNRAVAPVMTLLRGFMYVPLLSRLARLGTDLLATSIKLCADTRITASERTSL
tara:strand:+ start:2898 stop:3971 length:1074 start_codon:yes stop_codon:yes gene_type:complete